MDEKWRMNGMIRLYSAGTTLFKLGFVTNIESN